MTYLIVELRAMKDMRTSFFLRGQFLGNGKLQKQELDVNLTLDWRNLILNPNQQALCRGPSMVEVVYE